MPQNSPFLFNTRFCLLDFAPPLACKLLQIIHSLNMDFSEFSWSFSQAVLVAVCMYCATLICLRVRKWDLESRMEISMATKLFIMLVFFVVFRSEAENYYPESSRALRLGVSAALALVLGVCLWAARTAFRSCLVLCAFAGLAVISNSPSLEVILICAGIVVVIGVLVFRENEVCIALGQCVLSLVVSATLLYSLSYFIRWDFSSDQLTDLNADIGLATGCFSDTNCSLRVSFVALGALVRLMACVYFYRLWLKTSYHSLAQESGDVLPEPDPRLQKAEEKKKQAEAEIELITKKTPIKECKDSPKSSEVKV